MGGLDPPIQWLARNGWRAYAAATRQGPAMTWVLLSLNVTSI